MAYQQRDLELLAKFHTDELISMVGLDRLLNFGLIEKNATGQFELSALGRHTLGLDTLPSATDLIDANLTAPLSGIAADLIAQYGASVAIPRGDNGFIAAEAQKKKIAAGSPLESQVGGDHYKKLGNYQPWQVLAEWMTPEELRGFMTGTVIVYLARERDKGGDEDILKAMHTIQLWLELRKDK